MMLTNRSPQEVFKSLQSQVVKFKKDIETQVEETLKPFFEVIDERTEQVSIASIIPSKIINDDFSLISILPSKAQRDEIALSEITKDELYEMARMIDLPGRSKLTKKELYNAMKSEA